MGVSQKRQNTVLEDFINAAFSMRLDHREGVERNEKKNMITFKKTQEMELESWKPDPDKIQREIIRYPLLKKQMGLNYLDTSKMEVWDIGCGPLGGVSSVLNAKRIQRFDPLGKDYAKYYPQYNMNSIKAEELTEALAVPDLIIVTNALDHFDNPELFLKNIAQYMKAGSYFAHLHAINNAYSHKHEAHVHNVNPEMFKEYLSKDFETVWHLDYLNDGLTYSWKKQPAFSGLYRKSTY
jgi:2-polyprenyl-3-methyl-5-hydroxy-6-metoxy-1,4-benzoquinol methylase